MYERNLSAYLAHDFETWKRGVRIIMPVQAQHLRDKYHREKDV